MKYESGHFSEMWNKDGSRVSYYVTSQAAAIAQDLLDQELNKAPTIYTTPRPSKIEVWSYDKIKGDTHKAKIICITEIK